MRHIPLAALAALALAAAPAAAEKADRDKEIVVGADHALFDDANKVSNFEGNVVITQGTMRVTANKVTVREDPERHKFYVAYGAPVTFRQKRDNVDEYVDGVAERAEFDDLNDIVKLFNRAKVKSAQNELTGEFISYDMKRDLAEVTGAPAGAKQSVPSRVKMIITPAKKAPEAADPAKAPAADPAKAPAATGGIQLKPDAGPR